MAYRVNDYEIRIVDEGSTKSKRMFVKKAPTTKQVSERSAVKSLVYARTLKDVGMMFGSRVGDYTGNRALQRKINRANRLASIGLMGALNPVVGGIALASYMAEDGLDLGIRIMRNNQQARYSMRVSGNTETSGSRYGGKRR